MFGFALVTADHDLHHTQSKYNYSKRFILWDRVFGTYKQPPERHIPVK
jgi:sterol desaturase/sphingolipid hydroxylase (fatty acid hydroxylase superfamily)